MYISTRSYRAVDGARLWLIPASERLPILTDIGRLPWKTRSHSGNASNIALRLVHCGLVGGLRKAPGRIFDWCVEEFQLRSLSTIQ